MKAQYNKVSDVQYISPEALKYFEAMKAAQAEGGNLADYIDQAGMEALRKITGFAGGDKAEGGVVRTIPSVTEVDPSTGRTTGYDLFSLLMKQRIILLEGQVDDTMAQIACASLLYLSSSASGVDPKEPITMHINSPGGSVIAGLAIYDTMRFVSSPITTIGVGYQASMGSVLLAAGDHRMMTENSLLMIHSLGSGGEGKISDLDISNDFSERLFEKLKDIYVRHIGLTHEFWDLALERDTWLSADQALKMGFIHEVVKNSPKKATAYEKESIRDDFQKAREGQVPDTAQGIINVLNNVSSRMGEASKLRPELVTALSQFPRFWTKAKQKEKAAEAKATAVSNDNEAAPASAAKKKTASGTAPA